MTRRKFSELRDKMSPEARARAKRKADLMLENIRLRTALEIVRDSMKGGISAAGVYYLTKSTYSVVKDALEPKATP